MVQHGRHAVPRRPRRRAVLLPSVLLAAAGTAFAGMVVAPAAAEGAAPAPAVGRAADATSVRADVDLLVALQERAAQRPAPRGPARPPAHASRDRARARNAALPSAPAATPVAVQPPKPAPPPPPPAPVFVRPGAGGLTSPFGPRWGRLHAGIDLAAGIGSPVTAVTAAVVLSAGTEGGYGKVVRLQHAESTVTLYAHLSEILVSPGQAVGTGHLIGREGSSGASTGPHLHFEVRVDGTPVDPSAWLRARGIGV